MAGSLKYFQYETDEGDTFYIQMDESNGEAVGNQDVATDPTNFRYAIPRNIRPRRARYRSIDGRYSREIPVSTSAILAAVGATITVQDGNGGTIELSLVARIGELTRYLPIAADTGIDDGDAT